jgi:hypothetical protein
MALTVGQKVGEGAGQQPGLTAATPDSLTSCLYFAEFNIPGGAGQRCRASFLGHCPFVHTPNLEGGRIEGVGGYL